MTKDISTLLQEAKAMTGWSETRLAKELGISQATVNRILRGQGNSMHSTGNSIAELHARVSKRRKNSTKN